MYRSTWNRWLKTLDGRRARQKTIVRRLTLTHLEQRETPAAFAPGDVVVYRVGTGATLTAGAATAAFLDEYSPTGTLVQSIALPTANSGSNLALTASGTQAGTTILGDGSLTDSTDGRYLLAVGYNATPGTTGVVGLSSATNPRVIARVDSNGNIDTSTAITNGYTANNIDDAASPDGVSIWTGGFDSSGSVRQTIFGTNGAATPINTGTSAFSKSNSRIVSVGNNQVYGSNSTTNIDGVFSVGTGLPTTSGQPSTILNGFPTAGSTGTPAQFANPYQYIFDGPNTVYVADARTNGNGGLQKWTFDGTFWNLQYTVKGNPIPNTAYTNGSFTQPQLFEGLIGLVGNFSGPNPVFYGITSETTSTTLGGTNSTSNGAIPQDHLVQIVDMGSAAASTETVLATAATNEIFRGVAFAPTPIGTAADSVSVSSSGSPAPVGSPVTLTATVTGASAPSGWITFQDTSTTPATTVGVMALASVSGTMSQAQFTSSTLSVGTHTIKAIYGGDGTYVTGNNSTSQVISGTTTSTVVTSNSPLPTAAGVVVTFTATITPATGSAAPTGTVTFYDNGLPINTTPITPTASGSTDTATVTETTNAIQGTSPLLLTPGSHTITAIFTATGTFVGSDNTATPLVQNVKPNAFGAGDLLVYRAGDGVNPLSPGGATGNVVYIDEFNTAAGQTTPIQSIVMPTTAVTGGNQALVTTGQQSVEGDVSLSTDGQYLFLTGYDVAPGVLDPHTSGAATTPRTIGRISFDGTIDTAMALTDAADGGSFRGVASPDGNQVYVTGSTGGVRYVANYTPGLTTSTELDSGANAYNSLMIANGQLYVSSGAANSTVLKVATVGTGLPTTSGQTVTNLTAIPTGAATPIEPQSFFFTKLMMGPTVGPDTLYIADNGDFSNGTITKWSLISGTWTLTDTITSGPGSDNPTAPSFADLTGTVNAGTTSLYVTYGNGGNNITGPGFLYSITDSGGYNAAIPNHTATTLASAPTNEVYRGVAFVPTQAAVAPPTVAGVQVNDGSAQRSEVRSLTVTFSGPVTFTGGNSNAAAAFQLKNLTNGASVANLAAAVSTNAMGQTTATLTFTATGNASTVIDPESVMHSGAASLADGLYQLTILSADVSGAGGALAGGGAGGNYVSPTDTLGGGAGELGLFRLFGDATGNGVVDQLDLAQFRAANNSTGPGSPYVAYLDADNSGTIDQLDLAQFRARNNSNVFGV